MPEPDVPNASPFTSLLKARTEHTRSARYQAFVGKVLATCEAATDDGAAGARAGRPAS